jgi:hypothetical protein
MPQIQVHVTLGHIGMGLCILLEIGPGVDVEFADHACDAVGAIGFPEDVVVAQDDDDREIVLKNGTPEGVVLQGTRIVGWPRAVQCFGRKKAVGEQRRREDGDKPVPERSFCRRLAVGWSTVCRTCRCNGLERETVFTLGHYYSLTLLGSDARVIIVQHTT